MVQIRPEQPADFPAVYEINETVFEGPDEARLVDALRPVADPFLSWVAERDGAIVGHILFTPVSVVDGGETWSAMGLGPVAVLPKYQNLGIGSKLIQSGLEACRLIDQPIIFVLGHQEYYPRFGFQPAVTRDLHFSDPNLDPHFFMIELTPGALAGRKGFVHYLPPFDDT